MLPGDRRAALLMLAVGGHGLAVQVVLMRELMAAYAGNELAAALTLSVWLGAEALGAWRAGTLRPEPGSTRLAATAVAAAVVPMLAIPGAVLSRALFGLLGGEQPGLAAVVGAALLATFLPAFLHGLLFVEGCGRWALREGRPGIGRGYAWEGLGTAAAGAVIAGALFTAVPGLGVVAGFGILLLLACPGDGAPARLRVILGLAVFALTSLALFSPGLERLAWQQAWPGYHVREVRDNRYGKTALLAREGETALVHDGMTVATSTGMTDPVIEQSVVVPLLYAGRPTDAGRVLLLDGDPRLVEPLLRFPVAAVTIVATDRQLFEQRRAVTSALPDDPRLQVVFDDPRLFLARETGAFDCIIAPGFTPRSLAANRLTTVEFYRLCRRRLLPGGVVAVTPEMEGAAVGRISASLLASRHATLAAVFDTVQLLALDSPVLLAGRELTTGPTEAAARLARWLRSADAALLDSAGLLRLLDRFRQDRLDTEVAAAGAGPLPGPNTDRHPRAFFLALTSDARSPNGSGGLLYSWQNPMRASAVTILLLFALVMLLASRRAVPARRTVAIATSGFTAGALVALAMLFFQTTTGALYAGLTLLLTCFMLGTVAGGWLGGRVRAEHAGSWFIVAEITLIALPLLSVPIGASLPGWFLLPLLVAAGCAVGFQFPVAAADPRAVSAPYRGLGPLTAADLAGGIIGGALIPLLVLPAAGLGPACLLLALTKMISLALQFALRRV